MKKSSHKGVYWKTQLPVDYLDDSLVQNNWENVVADLSGGKPVRFWYVIIEQTNNGATAEDLELEITINGTAYTISVTADDSQPYFVFLSYSLVAGDFAFGTGTSCRQVLASDIDQSAPMSCENVSLIRVRQTSDVDGVAAQIEVNIVWDRLEP